MILSAIIIDYRRIATKISGPNSLSVAENFTHTLSRKRAKKSKVGWERFLNNSKNV